MCHELGDSLARQMFTKQKQLNCLVNINIKGFRSMYYTKFFVTTHLPKIKFNEVNRNRFDIYKCLN